MRHIFLSAIFLLFSTASAYDRLVNYVNTVDAVQANIEGLDIYESLTELRDSLAEIDTLHNRVDSLMTRDSIFYAYDAAGGLSIPTETGVPIPLDTEVFEDGIYGHGADKEAVAVSTAGRYRIGYGFSVEPSTTGVDEIGFQGYLQRYNSGWSAIAGSYRYGSVTDASGNKYYMSVDATVFIELSSGDSVRIVCHNFDLSTGLVTMGNSVNLRIEKIQ